MRARGPTNIISAIACSVVVVVVSAFSWFSAEMNGIFSVTVSVFGNDLDLGKRYCYRKVNYSG